jgi:hypothetical protein
MVLYRFPWNRRDFLLWSACALHAVGAFERTLAPITLRRNHSPTVNPVPVSGYPCQYVTRQGPWGVFAQGSNAATRHHEGLAITSSWPIQNESATKRKLQHLAPSICFVSSMCRYPRAQLHNKPSQCLDSESCLTDEYEQCSFQMKSKCIWENSSKLLVPSGLNYCGLLDFNIRNS